LGTTAGSSPLPDIDLISGRIGIIEPPAKNKKKPPMGAIHSVINLNKNSTFEPPTPGKEKKGRHVKNKSVRNTLSNSDIS
jgi:hypothetical protein